jgi:acyl-CoA thioester hydrolase
MTNKKGTYENRVRFAETDLQGVVFYGNYFTYQDETFYEYLRQIGYPNKKLQENEWDVHVIHVSMDFTSFAEFEELLLNTIEITSIGETSLRAEYTVYSQDDNEELATGEVVYVAVGPDSEPTRVPDDFREAVREFQGGISENM